MDALAEQILALNACPAYVVVVADPDTGESDAHGPLDGLAATITAAQLRAELDTEGLTGVAVTVLRLHRPTPTTHS